MCYEICAYRIKTTFLLSAYLGFSLSQWCNQVMKRNHRSERSLDTYRRIAETNGWQVGLQKQTEKNDIGSDSYIAALWKREWSQWLSVMMICVKTRAWLSTSHAATMWQSRLVHLSTWSRARCRKRVSALSPQLLTSPSTSQTAKTWVNKGRTSCDTYAFYSVSKVPMLGHCILKYMNY